MSDADELTLGGAQKFSSCIEACYDEWIEAKEGSFSKISALLIFLLDGAPAGLRVSRKSSNYFKLLTSFFSGLGLDSVLLSDKLECKSDCECLGFLSKLYNQSRTSSCFLGISPELRVFDPGDAFLILIEGVYSSS